MIFTIMANVGRKLNNGGIKIIKIHKIKNAKLRKLVEITQKNTP